MREFVKSCAQIADFSGFFSKPYLEFVRKELTLADMPFSELEWVNFSIIISIFFGACIGIIAFYFMQAPIIFVSAAFISFALAVFALLKFPSCQKHRRAEEIESEFSLALGIIIIGIRMDSPFEKIIYGIARGNYGKLSLEFSKIASQIESGISVPDALNGLCERIESQISRRIVCQIIFCYENGNRPKGLEKLAFEISLLQKTKIKEFGTKISFLGLMFLSIACIVPALFAAYAIIGSSFMSMSLTTMDIYLAYFLVFPSLSGAVLLYIKEKTPKVISM